MEPYMFVSRQAILFMAALLFALAIPLVSRCQETIEQLEKQYGQTRPKSEQRANVAGKYARALFFSQQVEKSTEILHTNLTDAQSFTDKKYAAYLSTILAMNYRIMDDLPNTRKYRDLAASYATQTKDYVMKGYVYYGQGWLHLRDENENEAIRAFLQGLDWLEKSPPSDLVYNRKSSILLELASIYANWKEYSLFEKYTKQSLAMAIKQNDPAAIFNAYMSMGFMYEQQHLHNPNQLPLRDSTEGYYIKAIHYYLDNEARLPIVSDLSFAATNLANLYLRYYPAAYKDKVLQYAKLAIEKGEQAEHHTHIASGHGIIAELEMKENRLEHAKAHLLKSMAEIRKDPMADQKIIMSIQQKLSEIYESEGNMEEAIHYYKNYIQLYSAVYDAEKVEQGRRLEAQFETERKEQRMVVMQLEAEKKDQQIDLMHVNASRQKQELQNMKLHEDNQRKKLELADLKTEKQTQELRLARLESQQRAQDILTVQNELSYKDKLTRNYAILTFIFFALILVLAYAYQQRSKAMLQKEEIHKFALEKEKQNSKISTLTALLDGQEQERGRLARDLHDGLGGILSGTKIQLSQINDRINEKEKKEVEKSLNLLDTAVNELRRVAHNLMPDLLQKYGLEESLADYASRMSSQTLDVDVQFLHVHTQLPQEQQLIVYRIIQELVNNAIKHAQADQILIQLVQEQHTLTLTVEDNGRGFDTKQAQSKKSAGLLNIQSRVDFLKGRMDLQSSLGLATTVEIELPIV